MTGNPFMTLRLQEARTTKIYEGLETGPDNQPSIPRSIDEAGLVLEALSKGWCHAVDAGDGREMGFENSIKALLDTHPDLRYPEE